MPGVPSSWRTEGSSGPVGSTARRNGYPLCETPDSGLVPRQRGDEPSSGKGYFSWSARSPPARG